MLIHLSIHWFPLLPPGAIALLIAALLALTTWGTWLLFQKRIPQRWVIGLGAARVVAVLLFAACLLQPALSYLKKTSHPPELVVLVDASQSMGRSDADGGSTRLAGAIDSLQKSNLLDTLGRRFDLKLFAFDRRAYPVDATELKSLHADGPATDFAAALGSAEDLLAAERADGDRSNSSRRVLLVSDGRNHGGGDFAQAALAAGATVDVLPVGGERGSKAGAAAIARVQAPTRVLLASETQFRVVVDRGTDPVKEFVLTLYEDGEPRETQEVVFEERSPQRRVTLAHRPTQVGLKRYEFALQPKTAPAPATKTSPPDDDERYAVDVQVIDDKLEVLALEDRWRWEFKFFRRVLEDDPSFSLTAMLARGGGAFMQLGEPDRGVNLGGFPHSRAELDWFDVLVLGDVRPSRWPTGLAAAVADAVIDGGKSLVVVAGPSLGEFAQVPELHTLLPVELSAESGAPIEGPLDVRLTPEGAAGGIFADGDRGMITQLPAVERIYAAQRKRPGATVLVEAATAANASGRLIVLAEQTVGRGRVLYVATDALWKWQTLAPTDADGRTLYGKFWQQALRALAPQRTASAGLWLAADRTRTEVGDQLTLRAEAPILAEVERAKLAGTVTLPDGRRLPLAFEPDPNSAESYTASFDVVAPGRYGVSLAALVDGAAAAETSLAIEAIVARGETDDDGVDRAALEQIAARTGGRVVDPNDPQTWPTPAAGPTPEVEERRTVNLWDNFTLLTLLCLVLGGDWLARLLRGYA